MKVPYKPFPVKDSPGFPGIEQHWIPVLLVAIVYRRQKSQRFEAIVDSGSPWCLFHSDIGRAVGIKVEQGKQSILGGVISGTANAPVYFHKIKLAFMEHIIDVTAGFSDELSVAAILGRQGFFDNCVVTFDPTGDPPGLDVQRFYRS